ncbi:MAG: helix-turn-helix domain-containing protein [Burkholderiaceae bacterium]|nr:helix-turn-helix domain-containing protein [Burkholderiaceae bacterium]
MIAAPAAAPGQDGQNPPLASRKSSAVEPSVIKTAGRVFEVLEYMGEVRRPVTVREISERLGYPLSSAQALLKSIATLGYLRYDSLLRAYLATPRLASLGEWVVDSMFAGGQLFGALEDIARKTGFKAILAVENGIYAHYVRVIVGNRPMVFNVQPGTRRLLCMSGLGWALLAASSDEHVARIIHRTNLRLGDGGQAVAPDYVKAQVRETRERGYAFSRAVVTEGIGIVAVSAAASHAPDTRLAIGAGGPVAELEATLDAVLRVLREHAAAAGPVTRR